MGNDGHIVSVVVPTVGRDAIAHCRNALSGQTRAPDEVIIVTDKDRRGPSWARNEGIRRSRGNLIAFTDDDCIPPPDWLERLVLAVDRHNAAGAGGTFDETDPLLRAKHRRRGFPGTDREDTGCWVGNTGNILYRRRCLDDCVERDGQVFNEAFCSPGGEDIELAWRLRRKGERFVYVANPVTHLRSMTPIRYFSHQFRRGKGIGRLFLLQRSGDSAVPMQKSLIFGAGSDGKVTRWITAGWRKGFGPFDKGSFDNARQFAVFWAGEKCEGAGFLWFLIRYLASR